MRKWALVCLGSFCLIIGIWAYCCMSSTPVVSEFARRTTCDVSHSMGINAFDGMMQGQTSETEPKPLTIADLPEGYYVYVGSRPMQAAPKWVVINPGANIAWLNNDTTPPVTPKKSPATVTAAATSSKPSDGSGQFEEYAYPVIKWRAKPLPGDEGAIAQLSTTFDRSQPGQQGVVKYRLTVFKSTDKRQREVQLLDAMGFKLHEFHAGDFHEIPNSQLMESRDSFPCDETEYQQARDYSVN